MTREKKPNRRALGDSSEIGKRLKEYYNDLVSEDVPRRFVDLLNQLERADSDQRHPQGEDRRNDQPDDSA